MAAVESVLPVGSVASALGWLLRHLRLRLGCLLRHLRLSLLLLLYVLLHQFRRYRAAVLAHLLLHAHQLCHHFL